MSRWRRSLDPVALARARRAGRRLVAAAASNAAPRLAARRSASAGSWRRCCRSRTSMPLATFMAEHWLYVPLMGLFLAIGWAVTVLAARYAAWTRPGIRVAVLAVALAVAAYRRDSRCGGTSTGATAVRSTRACCRSPRIASACRSTSPRRIRRPARSMQATRRLRGRHPSPSRRPRDRRCAQQPRQHSDARGDASARRSRPSIVRWR